jgi:hypothetical protein
MLAFLKKNVTFSWIFKSLKLKADLLVKSVNIYKLIEIIAKIILYFRLISLDSDKDKLLMFVPNNLLT